MSEVPVGMERGDKKPETKRITERHNLLSLKEEDGGGVFLRDFWTGVVDVKADVPNISVAKRLQELAKDHPGTIVTRVDNLDQVVELPHNAQLLVVVKSDDVKALPVVVSSTQFGGARARRRGFEGTGGGTVRVERDQPGLKRERVKVRVGKTRLGAPRHRTRKVVTGVEGEASVRGLMISYEDKIGKPDLLTLETSVDTSGKFTPMFLKPSDAKKLDQDYVGREGIKFPQKSVKAEVWVFSSPERQDPLRATGERSHPSMQSEAQSMTEERRGRTPGSSLPSLQSRPLRRL